MRTNFFEQYDDAQILKTFGTERKTLCKIIDALTVDFDSSQKTKVNLELITSIYFLQHYSTFRDLSEKYGLLTTMHQNISNGIKRIFNQRCDHIKLSNSRKEFKRLEVKSLEHSPLLESVLYIDGTHISKLIQPLIPLGFKTKNEYFYAIGLLYVIF